MLYLAFSFVVLILALLPTLMILRNFPLFREGRELASEPTKGSEPSTQAVSVLIPARNEADGIEACLSRVLSNHDIPIEVLVLDDHSEDPTADIVNRMAKEDARLRLVQSRELPSGWNGKQHACWQLAQEAKHELLFFLDADVHISSRCIATLAHRIDQVDVALLSGFPRQELGTLSEKLLIPMMYYVLLGYLPLDQMRSKADVGFGAGCGQMFLARRKAYFDCGGHEAIKNSRHDGLKLPRAFRSSEFMTDLMDASAVANVRMYEGWRQVASGLLKNATEGIANWKLIVIFSLLLIGGSVVPILAFGHAIFWQWYQLGWTGVMATALLGVAFLGNIAGATRLHFGLGHPFLTVLLHPLAVGLFMLLQWFALMRQQLGLKQVAWRGRN